MYGGTHSLYASTNCTRNFISASTLARKHYSANCTRSISLVCDYLYRWLFYPLHRTHKNVADPTHSHRDQSTILNIVHTISASSYRLHGESERDLSFQRFPEPEIAILSQEPFPQISMTGLLISKKTVQTKRMCTQKYIAVR